MCITLRAHYSDPNGTLMVILFGIFSFLVIWMPRNWKFEEREFIVIFSSLLKFYTFDIQFNFGSFFYLIN